MSRTEFRERIRASLASPTLQMALDANAERRVTGRITAFASLPDWPERRRQAHTVRADVIEHLEDYLERFIHKAESNGIVVHRAADAAQAIQIILRIMESDVSRRWDLHDPDHRSHRTPLLVAKSKSMVSEEIGLNQALEAHGSSTGSARRIRVVETDLGEYIVQLRDEKPTHIITPAVHLRRQDVGRLFHEKLGIPYTEDISVLTDTARKVLREVFLTADVGISGVNFGVAETGALCLVTNEGNGRMVTTLPPVHIALMGMERLVRNLDDLALMLSLLPRSATTQKLSVYTQLIHAPFPGQQRHLVVLDNGRSRLRNSPLRESLYCIRCGACLNACPVFREIGGHGYDSVYPGPIGSVISAGFFGPEFVPLAQASSLCGACREACPVDIDLPKLLTRVRAGEGDGRMESGKWKEGKPEEGRGEEAERKEGKKKEGEGLSALGRVLMQVYSRVARHPGRFARAQKFAAWGTRLLSPRSDYLSLPALTGWGYSKDFPRFAGKTFRERFAELQVEETGTQRLVDRYTAKQELVEEGGRGQTVRGGDELALQFADELKKVNGDVIFTRPDELTGQVIELLREHKIDAIQLEPGLMDESALHKAGIAVSDAPDPTLRAGVTRAVCGLADTGSILIVDGEGQPLLASLLPAVHIAVLHKSDILPSLADALALPIISRAKAAVVITGPSRTADIEMSLTIGMHGPGALYVFLVHTIC